jgi:hypothetical protein
MYRRGGSAYAAAKKHKIALSTIYRAIYRRRDAAYSEAVVREFVARVAVRANALIRRRTSHRVTEWEVSQTEYSWVWGARFVTDVRNSAGSLGTWYMEVSEQLARQGTQAAIDLLALDVVSGVRELIVGRSTSC